MTLSAVPVHPRSACPGSPPRTIPAPTLEQTTDTGSPTVSRTVHDVLLAAGVTDVFGVMGNGNVHFLDAVCHSGIHFTAGRHEAGAVAAADAFARVSGLPGIATCTYGAGFTNTMTPLAEAVRAHTPLVLVAGDAPTSGLRDWDVDQAMMAAAAGARTFTVAASDAAAVTLAALQHAIDARTAVVLAIPHDVGAAPSTAPPIPGGTALRARTPRPVDGAALDSAVRLLTAAQRPLVLAGRGVRVAGAGPDLRRLADRLGAHTCTTAPTLGLFAGRPGDLGVAGGFSSPSTAAAIAAADVVLVVGAGLNQFTTAYGSLFGSDAVVIQIDDAGRATHPRVDLFVAGDAAEALRACDYRLDSLAPDGEGGNVSAADPWRRNVTAPLGQVGSGQAPGDTLAPDGRLDPRSLFTRLDALLPAERVIVSDGGHFIGWAPMYLRIPAPDHLVLIGTALQSIGLGLAGGVGAAVAAPEDFLVVVSGDGGGLMALADLESLTRVTRRGVLVVVNDAAYGAEVQQFGATALGLAEEPMRIPEVDFASLGAALGAHAATVRSLVDLEVLRWYVESGATGLLVLDCRVSGDVVAPYIAGMATAAARR